MGEGNERCQAFVIAYSGNERCQAFVIAYSEKTTSKAGAASSAPTKSMSKPEKTSRNPLGQESFRGDVGWDVGWDVGEKTRIYCMNF